MRETSDSLGSELVVPAASSAGDAGSEKRQRMLAAVGFYLSTGWLDAAAEDAGMSMRSVVKAIAYLMLGGRGELDEGNAPRYGMGYSSAEVQAIMTQIGGQVPLPEIARSVGRTQLGVAWKTLQEPEVHTILASRKFELGPVPVLWFTLARFGIDLEGSNYAAGDRSR